MGDTVPVAGKNCRGLDTGEENLQPGLSIPDLISNVESVYNIDALIRIGDAAVGPILEHWNDKSTCDYRESLAYVLCGIGGEKGLIALLYLLDQSEDRYKPLVVKMLVEMQGDGAFDAIIKSLKNCHDANSRMEIMQTILNSEGEGAKRAAAEVFANINNEDLPVKVWLMDILIRMGDRRGIDAAVQTLPKTDDPRIIQIIAALTAPDARLLKDERVLNVLISLMQNSNIAIRASAVEAAATIGGKKAKEPLLKALLDDDYHVYTAAYTGLRKIGFDRCDAEKLLNSRNPEVRANALEDIVKIDGKDALHHVVKALFDHEYIVSESAFKCLGDIGVENMDAELLLTAIETERVKIEEEALKLIDEIRMAKNIQPTLKVLFDKQPEQQATVDKLADFNLNADKLSDMIYDYKNTVRKLGNLIANGDTYR